ncbi:unnamed protein product (macronuclear) [Paramecium tetraurelia]|uniref:BZIP domain-containing protein n=1 Tax=Paramecium tetraurelia TaxID=5888 RepID=A0D337_PARTE|nr:uncharacterized protein GSPATT00012939001 [Paramecium tetraurelia]CAK77454.1 unnamed protein product [Paramecium tetraurelia]|eukprot:XP_001444851.1 hypothetical protein (macronuclear) [Paramecium tetraurelia strain d4-2]
MQQNNINLSGMSTSQQELFEYMSETLQTSEKGLLEMQQSNPQNFQKLVEKMKRTMRREKAKQRKNKEEPEIVSSSKKIKRKKEDDDPLRDNDKKTIQMIRNRISAQNSRDRKKQYLHQLESQAQKELDYNNDLRKQLEDLQEKHQKLTNKSSKIRNQLTILQQLGRGSRLGKISLASLDPCVSVFKQQHQTITTPLVKIEEMSSESAMRPINYEKSYSIIDTNTFFEEEKLGVGVSEESENCYNQLLPISLYRLNSQIEYELGQHS